MQDVTDARFSRLYSMKSISEVRQNIQAWKAHLLRSINQDAARHEILENLDAKFIFLTMDWAMKFL